MFCAGVFSSEYLEEKDDVYLGYISLCYMCKYILNVTHGVHVLQECFTSVVICVGVIMLNVISGKDHQQTSGMNIFNYLPYGVFEISLFGVKYLHNLCTWCNSQRCQ